MSTKRKDLSRKYGIPGPKGIPAFSVAEADKAAETLIAETGNEVVVVKAQIHAGGRGKAGGARRKGAAAAPRSRPSRRSSGCSWSRTRPDPEGKKVQRLLDRAGASTWRASSTSPPSSTVTPRRGHRSGVDRGRHRTSKKIAEKTPREDPQGRRGPGGGPRCRTAARASWRSRLGLMKYGKDRSPSSIKPGDQPLRATSSRKTARSLEVNPLDRHQERPRAARSTPS